MNKRTKHFVASALVDGEQRRDHGQLAAGNSVALRHGHTRRDGWRSPEYNAWSSMLVRCENPKHLAYKRYGAKGITVCLRWHTFENFLADMGPCPAGMSLDRFPNRDGNYEPGNCRWATNTEQIRNRDATKLDLDKASEILGRLEHGEFEKSVAARFGISRATVSDIKCGRIYRELSPFQQPSKIHIPPKGLLTQVATTLAEGPLSLEQIVLRIGKRSTAASSATRLIRTTLVADMKSKGAASFFMRVPGGQYALRPLS